MLAGLTFGSKKELEKQFREEAELEKAKKREERKLSKKQKKVWRCTRLCIASHHATCACCQ